MRVRVSNREEMHNREERVRVLEEGRSVQVRKPAARVGGTQKVGTHTADIKVKRANKERNQADEKVGKVAIIICINPTKSVGKRNSNARASTAPPITCDAVRYKPRSSAP